MAEITFDSVSTAPVQRSSCDECKSRKLKCNRRLPCTNCDRRAFKCTYAVKSKNAAKRRRLDYDNNSKGDQDSSAVVRDSRNGCLPAVMGLRDSPVTSFKRPSSILLPETPEEDWGLLCDETTMYSPSCLLHEFDPQNLHGASNFAPSHDALLGNLEISESQNQMPWLDTQSWMDTIDPLSALPLVPDRNLSMSARTYFLDCWPDIIESFWPSRIQHSHLLKIASLYLRQIHPSIPLFRTIDLIESINSSRYRTDRHFGAMILGLCTFTLLQPQQPNASLLSGDTLNASDFLHEAMFLRRSKDIEDNPTLDSLLADIFIFGALDLLGKKNAAWLKLQESITISEILNLADMDNLYTTDAKEWEKRTRVYLCLLFIERAYTFGRWRRLSVPAVPPTLLQRFSQLSLEGDVQPDNFERKNIAVIHLMVETFDCLEDDIISCWANKCGLQNGRRTCDKLSSERILGLLRRVPRSHHKDWLKLSESRVKKSSEKQDDPKSSTDPDHNEQGDVLLTCLWVMNRLWHLALTHGHVAYDNAALELRPSFPIIIARMALVIVKSFTIGGLELHGEGLGEKMFDIASDFIGVAFLQCDRYLTQDTNSCQLLDFAELQKDFDLFNSNQTLSFTDEPIPTTHNNSDAASNSLPASNIDIANGFLGFFALFKNGQHSFLQSYMDLYKRFAGNNV